VGPVGFDAEQQALIWAMWRRGDAIREMERTLGETLPRIRRYLRESGGIPPIPRRRRVGHLTLVEREEISRGVAAGLSARMIAGRIDRPSSTVSREIARNGGRDAYRALVADAAAFERARRPKPSKLAANVRLRDIVADKLDDDWSPQQIAQWLRREFGVDAAMRISHDRSIVTCICRRGKCLTPACFTVSGASVRSGGRAQRSVRTVAARSGTWSPSVSDRPRRTPGRWPAIGRAISCLERARRRSPPSLTAPPVTRWSSRCPTGTRPTRWRAR
jgi:Helix-turn-helix domain